MLLCLRRSSATDEPLHRYDDQQSWGVAGEFGTEKPKAEYKASRLSPADRIDPRSVVKQAAFIQGELSWSEPRRSA